MTSNPYNTNWHAYGQTAALAIPLQIIKFTVSVFAGIGVTGSADGPGLPPALMG